MVHIIIRNLGSLRAKLSYLVRKAAKDHGAAARVTYGTHYAVYVHENLQIDHSNHANNRDCGGQAKFLEDPARTRLRDITLAARKVYRQKKEVRPALLAAAEALLAYSLPLVPVDTGDLQQSGNARLE